MAAESIYFDNNSTTAIDPRVVEAMVRAWRECGANPASQHAVGRRARRILEEAREGIAELLGAKAAGMDADQVIFTSGGTEANNLAVVGIQKSEVGSRKSGTAEEFNVQSSKFKVTEVPRLRFGLVISGMEHPSVVGAAEEVRRRGGVVDVLGVGADGWVNSECRMQNAEFGAREAFQVPSSTFQVGDVPRLRFGLVSVMLANNETGVVQPVGEIAATAHEQGMLMHTDAVQAVGKIAVNFRELGVDAMTVAAHKFHGPLGIGALVVRGGVKVQPLMFGGFQQGGLRPGTENVALAAGFFEALKIATAELPERAERMRELRDELERRLLAELNDVVIVGEKSLRLPNTSCVSILGVERQALVMALDLAGVACSTGSACASGSSEPSATLVAMGLSEAVIGGAIRLSLGAFTTGAEVAEGARRIIKSVKHLRSKK